MGSGKPPPWYSTPGSQQEGSAPALKSWSELWSESWKEPWPDFWLRPWWKPSAREPRLAPRTLLVLRRAVRRSNKRWWWWLSVWRWRWQWWWWWWGWWDEEHQALLHPTVVSQTVRQTLDWGVYLEDLTGQKTKWEVQSLLSCLYLAVINRLTKLWNIHLHFSCFLVVYHGLSDSFMAVAE